MKKTRVKCPIDKSLECSFPIGNTGVYFVFPINKDCEYVRLVNRNGIEFAYWDSAEWAEEALAVMGEVMDTALQIYRGYEQREAQISRMEPE